MIKTLLLLLQAGKLGKVLLTGGTMLLSVIAYPTAKPHAMLAMFCDVHLMRI